MVEPDIEDLAIRLVVELVYPERPDKVSDKCFEIGKVLGGLLCKKLASGVDGFDASLAQLENDGDRTSHYPARPQTQLS